MPISVWIERCFPPAFFVSANRDNFQISSSENFGKAVSVVANGVNENDIRRGNPINHEPDFVLNDNSGYEITFASNREGKNGSSVLRLKNGNYKIDNTEGEIIKSILDSINEKANKKNNGNYCNVDEVSLIVICLDPLLFWYGNFYRFPSRNEDDLSGQLFAIYINKSLRRRNDFFTSLCTEYIANSIFENIYILQLTEFKTYVLFDLRKFQNNPDEFMTKIATTNLHKLPYCTVKKISGDSTFGITYNFHDVFMEMDTVS